MTQRFPDIELYILKPETTQIHEWLNDEFGSNKVELQPATNNQSTWHIKVGDEIVICVLTHKVEKNFASLWFNKNRMIWNNDLDAARSLYQSTKIEVRCSASGWKEGDPEDGSEEWMKLNAHGEKLFTW